MSRRPVATGARTATGAIAFVVLACSGARSAKVDPRFVAVHNAMVATGLVQIGLIQEGSLAEGREARVRLDLPARCATVVALGGIGVRDLELALLDADGGLVAREDAHDAQAAVRACVEKAGAHTLVVRMASGSGEWLAATWAGEGTGGSAPGGPDASLAPVGNGTCDSPLTLAAGVATGTTRHGESEHAGSCVSSSSSEMVYVLEVPRRQRVVLEVEATFDSVLHVRRDDCADEGAEVACNDDAPGPSSSRAPSNRHGSRVDEVLEPGRYFVFVDGYGSEEGSYKLSTRVMDVPSLAELCQRPRPLALGKVTGQLDDAFDGMHASCGDQAQGPDATYRLDLAARSRVRVTSTASDFSPIVHLRRQCVDESTELGCAGFGVQPSSASFVGILDPGSVTVVADATEKDAHGRFTLETEIAPEAGAGIVGDACVDALPLQLAERRIDGDTFRARDDVSGTCSGVGAPDVLYRFEIARRSRISAHFVAQEGSHVFVLQRTCGDAKTEIACTADVEEVIPAGTYSLAVDGAVRDGLGRYAFAFQARDVSAQETACQSAPLLAPGQKASGTTASAGDRFTTTCGAKDDGQGSGDRVYRIELKRRSRVQVRLSTPTFDGALALRSVCLDPPRARPPRGAEIACNNDAGDSRHSRLEATLDAGTYFVVVDGHTAANEGPFTLEWEVLN